MLFIGGDAVHIGLFVVVSLLVIGDIISGDDKTIPEYRYPGVFRWLLYSALPILVFLFLAGSYFIAGADPFNIGAAITSLFHENSAGWSQPSIGQISSAVILMGLMIGTIGTISAHELTHRTWDPISLLIGRWLLSFSFDTTFAIEHVYGHHKYVSTPKDPGTAPRGRNVYSHIVLSTIGGNISAWKIETRRLDRKGKSHFGWSNVLIRGYLMSLVLLVLSATIAGLSGLLFTLITGLFGKALLEIVNYIEHYGLIRDEQSPVLPHHSWNTNKRISSWAMFNLTRHSHHHADGSVPFHLLKPYPDAPMMVTGYLGTIMLTLIPPLWFKLMAPKLAEWDEKYRDN